MELGLSLGDASRLMEKPSESSIQLGLVFNTTLSTGQVFTKQIDQHQEQEETGKQKHNKHSSQSYSTIEEEARTESLVSPSLKATNNTTVQLDLLPHTPALSPINPPSNFSFLWDPISQNGGISCSSALDVNRVPVAVAVTAAEEEAALSSSANSGGSSCEMDLCILSRGGKSVTGEGYDHRRRVCCRASVEDENRAIASTRKKLRLSKEQSAFLEDSFKDHNTLNPKQKHALAKQLHLRPRQVEVWFQNRRARTKLKQTEVDCEHLKRWCDTLTEENQRLQKELQELRALKTSSPFYMQLPATTLTMCPSCERIATNSISTTSTTTTPSHEPVTSKAIEFPIGKPGLYPFPRIQSHLQLTSPQNLESN